MVHNVTVIRKVLTAFVAAVFLIVTMCAVLHQSEQSHEHADSAGSHCCAIAPSGMDLVKNSATPFFPAELMFLFIIIFYIPSKIPFNLYHPPRF